MNSTRPTPEPIPAPLRRYWREFRIRWLPVIAFVLMGACTAGLWHEVILPRTAVGPHESPTPDAPAAAPEPDGSDDPAVCARQQDRPAVSYTTNLGVRSPRPQN